MAITSSPSYPISGEIVSLSITGATGSTVATQFEITSVPDNSGLDAGMLTNDAGDATQEFTPDVAGAYEITAYDYRRFSGGAAYAGDPAGEARDILVATQTGTVYVADVLDLPIRGARHEITLRVKVVDDTIVEATLEDPTTEIARLAALDAGILSAVGALEDEPVTSIGDSLLTMAEEYAEKFNDHIDDASAHAAIQDEVHTLDPAKVGSVAGAIQRWHRIWDAFVGHLTTRSEGDWWHGELDYVHVPIASRSTDVAGAFVMMCDLMRCYTAHIVYESPIHDVEDATNTLPSPEPLTAAVIAVLDFFSEENPDPPAKENPGALLMAAKHGFVPAAA